MEIKIDSRILSKDGFKSLVSDIKLKAKLPPFLSMDQEGGRVERTENIYPKRLSAKFAYEKGREYPRLCAPN